MKITSAFFKSQRWQCSECFQVRSFLNLIESFRNFEINASSNFRILENTAGVDSKQFLKMYKAVVCKKLSKEIEDGINNNLEITSLPRKELPDPSCVRVQVHAAAVNFFGNVHIIQSVNFADLLQLVGKYQYKPPLPFVPVRC